MKLLWFLLSAAVMVQARPDGAKMSGGGESAPESKFVVTEDGTKPNPNVVEQDGASSAPDVQITGWIEDGQTSTDDPGKIGETTSEISTKVGGQQPTSNIINFDVTKPITAELSINFHQVQDPAPEPEPTCIDNWGYCRSSNTPCCGQQLVEDGTLGPKYFTCFEFSRRGLCVPLHHIDNLDLYAKLVDQLNSTNFAELDDQYWKASSYPKSMSTY